MSANVNAKPGENVKKQKVAGKKKGRFLSFLTVLLVAVIILAVFGGVFYYIVYNNIGDVTEKHYATLKRIPVLNLALPEEPDPLDPKYMTPGEITEQYRVFRIENEELKKRLEEAEAKIDEYRVYKDNYDNIYGEAQKKLDDLEEREARVKEKEIELREMEIKVGEIIANGDREAFKTYFEKLDPENAQIIYEKIVKEWQIDENVKKYARVFSGMDAAAAAAVFEQMGADKIGMIAETLRAMDSEGASKILESMAPDFAAKVAEKLDAIYRGD